MSIHPADSTGSVELGLDAQPPEVISTPLRQTEYLGLKLDTTLSRTFLLHDGHCPDARALSPKEGLGSRVDLALLCGGLPTKRCSCGRPFHSVISHGCQPVMLRRSPDT